MSARTLFLTRNISCRVVSFFCLDIYIGDTGTDGVGGKVNAIEAETFSTADIGTFFGCDEQSRNRAFDSVLERDSVLEWERGRGQDEVYGFSFIWTSRKSVLGMLDNAELTDAHDSFASNHFVLTMEGIRCGIKSTSTFVPSLLWIFQSM